MNNPNHDPRDYEPINQPSYRDRQQAIHLEEEQLRLIEEERRISRARRNLALFCHFRFSRLSRIC